MNIYEYYFINLLIKKYCLILFCGSFCIILDLNFLGGWKDLKVKRYEK